MSAQLWPNDLFPQDPEVQFTNGLSVLTLEEYPDRNLFFGNRVGTTDDGAAVVQWGSLNLEHIFAGIRTANSGDYSPRYEACVLTQVNEHEAQLEWSAEHSAWHASILKRFRLDPAHRQIDVDLEISFSRVPWNPLEVGLRRWLADLGFEAEWGTIDLRHAWIAFMDASYMYMTVKPDIYFYGQAAGQDGWLSVGRKDFTADVPGAVVGSAHGPVRDYDPEAETLNSKELDGKRFLYPFYFGEIDGDGAWPWDDAKLWIVMFDTPTDVQFVLWNWSGNDHLTAWDWQYTCRYPVPQRRYGLKCRVAIIDRPANFDPVVAEYERFRQDLRQSAPLLIPSGKGWGDVL